MDCRQTLENLEAFARDELDAACAQDVAAHLKTCANCRALHDDIFAVRVTLCEYADATVTVAAPDFNRRAMEKFAAMQSQPETPNTAPHNSTPRRVRQNPQAPLVRGLGVLPAFNFAQRLWAPLALACMALLICFTPSLRVAWRSQTSPVSLLTKPTTSSDRTERETQLLRELNAVAARHPENYRWKAVAFLPQPNVDSISVIDLKYRIKQSEKVMDTLLAQHPRDVWLLARRLRAEPYLVGWLYGSDGADPAQEKAEFTARTKAILPLAERGVALEPDNAFWSRTVAFWRFKVGDTEGALRAVAAAARQKQFNDYTLEDRRQSFALFSEQRPLLAEEKLWVWSSSALLTSGSGLVVSETVRAGARAEKAGDHVAALGFYRNALRLCIKASENEMNFAPRRLQRVLRRGKASNPIDLNVLTLQSFAGYARQHGRADLANEASRVFDLVSQREAARQKVARLDYPPGVPQNAQAFLLLQNAVQPSLRQFWHGGALLWLALGAFILLVPRLLSRFRGRLPAVFTKPTIALSAPPRRAVFGVFALCLLFALGACLIESAFANDPFDDSRWPIALRWLLPWLPIFWGILGCWSLAVRAQERTAGRQTNSLKRALDEHYLAALLPFAAHWTLTFTTIVAWGALIAAPDMTDDVIWGYIIGLAIFCAALCLLRIISRWARLPHRRAALGLAFVTLHGVLGASLVAGALLWVGLQLAVQPARRNVDTAIATLLRDGETKVVLRRAAQMESES